MSGPWASTTMYRCRACGAELFITKQDVAEHLVECEKADPNMRRLAQDWLDAGAPEMKAGRRSRRRHPTKGSPDEV
jgi:hypothetical protein